VFIADVTSILVARNARLIPIVDGMSTRGPQDLCAVHKLTRLSCTTLSTTDCIHVLVCMQVLNFA
jgi:hypothetical protein